MIGFEADGCFLQYVKVRTENVYSFSEDVSFEKIAYFEPVLAALAIIKKLPDQNAQIAIYGKNRFELLVKKILTYYGYKHVTSISPNSDTTGYHNQFDIIIETELTNKTLTDCCLFLNHNGLIFIKKSSLEKPNASSYASFKQRN